MKNLSPEKAIAILRDNEVNDYLCISCGGKLTPFKDKSFICVDCKATYEWKVEANQ